MNKNFANEIQIELSRHFDKNRAQWLENYVKLDIKSRGVGIPQIRSIVQSVYKQNKINELSPADQKKFLDELMKQDYTEDKLAAIIYVRLCLKDADVKYQLTMISNWFDKRRVYDWNICDWLCVRLLTPLVDKYPKQTIAELKRWNKDKYLWKARASLIPFAQCKTLKEHIELVDRFSIVLIKREERFCKTAVGWVLREISKSDKNYVENFSEAHRQFITQEVIKNSGRYFKN